MTLPPAWKIKRELTRVKTKLRKGSVLLVDRLRQARHDRNAPRLLRETAGARPILPRIAVFVLFQPQGLAASTFLTLDHLAQEGWSVVAISNAPLSQADRAQVAARCAHVIERPNTGYDFGAYREGWRWLDRQGHRPDRLILMNDSTWFPLRMDDDSLRRMEALQVDFAGHIYKNCHLETRRYDHVEAHLLMLGPRALASPAIHAFWSGYLMSNTREATIWRGEIPLSQAAIEAGLSVGSILDRDRLVALLRGLSDQNLLDCLRDLALDDPADETRRKGWLAAAASGRSWREDMLSWTEAELSTSISSLLSATFIIPAMRIGGIGFLKKSADPRFRLAQRAVRESAASGRIAPIDPRIAAEIRAVSDRAQGAPDWRATPARPKLSPRT